MMIITSTSSNTKMAAPAMIPPLFVPDRPLPVIPSSSWPNECGGKMSSDYNLELQII